MIELELKDIILSKYKSIRDFAINVNLPYTTVDSILKRGVDKANIINIISICRALNLDVDALADGKIEEKAVKSNYDLTNEEHNLLKLFRTLPPEGKTAVRIILEYENIRAENVKTP